VVDKLGCCVLRAACLGATTSTVGASPAGPAGPAAQQPASQHASIIGFVPSAGASRLAPTPDTLTSVPVAGRALLARRQRPPACRGCMAGLGVGAGSRWWSRVKVIVVVVVVVVCQQTAGRRQQTADAAIATAMNDYTMQERRRRRLRTRSRTRWPWVAGALYRCSHARPHLNAHYGRQVGEP
jgi:hypothetical protein